MNGNKIVERATMQDIFLELFLRKREELYWKSQNGEIIKLSEMTTDHLENALRKYLGHNDTLEIN